MIKMIIFSRRNKRKKKIIFLIQGKDFKKLLSRRFWHNDKVEFYEFKKYLELFKSTVMNGRCLEENLDLMDPWII